MYQKNINVISLDIEENARMHKKLRLIYTKKCESSGEYSTMERDIKDN